MKIYFNTYAAAFQCPGGGEIQLLKSKEALERRGHEVVLFDPWRHDLRDADVVHHFSVQGGSYNLCAFAHRSAIPLVISPILWLAGGPNDYPMDDIRFMLSIADVLCPNSSAEVERFVEWFATPRERYHVTHNGVDERFFDPVPAQMFREFYSIEGPFVLCVGNIEARKNQLALLAAARQVDVQVILLGNVRDRAYFDRMTREYEGVFRYLGHLDHESELLRSAYAACSAFALPSLLETPGLAALEAAAAGAALVITREGCTEEYFGPDAYLVDPGDVGDIARQLLRALESTHPSEALRRRVRRFTWDHVGEELEQAYAKARSTPR